jgi:hypothetical protein
MTQAEEVHVARSKVTSELGLKDRWTRITSASVMAAALVLGNAVEIAELQNLRLRIGEYETTSTTCFVTKQQQLESAASSSNELRAPFFPFDASVHAVAASFTCFSGMRYSIPDRSISVLLIRSGSLFILYHQLISE